MLGLQLFGIFLSFPITRASLIKLRGAQTATTPAAVIILQRNPACFLLSSTLSVCTSLTPGFTALPPSQQALCLCYSSTNWAPESFDTAVDTCASFASTACPSAYAPFANLRNFCSDVGNIYGPANTPAMTTGANRAAQSSACGLLNSLFQVCTSMNLGFVTLPVTNQAACLCYLSTSAWAPTVFDNAMSACAGFAKTTEISINPAVSSFKGFCASIGNFMSISSHILITQAPSTTVPPIFATDSALSTSRSTASQNSMKSTSSTDITVAIGDPATSTVAVGQSGHTTRKASEREVIVVSFVCASVLLFLW